MAVDQIPARPAAAVADTFRSPAVNEALTIPPFLTRPRTGALTSPRLTRALEMLPGALAIFLISILIWGYIWIPSYLAVALIVFDVYWFWKSWTIGYHVLKGVRMIRHFQARDWPAEYKLHLTANLPAIPWEDVRHVVLIPNYNESVEKLSQNLTAMAACTGARDNIIPVLAMEEGDKEAHAKAAILEAAFRDRFLDLLVTFHPLGLPGEIRGKSSNEAWAAREAVAELVSRRGLDIDHLTVTSCDADTQFPDKYFECLTFKFATDPKRYRRFWQAPIFFYNNIWQVPAPLRVPNAMSGMIHLSRLSRHRKVLFSQSTYSLSMRMAHDVDYWATDVIPEDWHMFMRCFYNLGGAVEVEPIHLPIGNDGALSRTTRLTYVNHYLQVRRWAWGAVDIPFFFMEALRRHDIPIARRYLRFWYMFENHITWSTQWFFITLGGFIPFVAFHLWGVKLMPGWFKIASSLILTPCLIPYAVMIFQDFKMRPPAPGSLSRAHRIFGLVNWALISPITFFFSALPALDSQMRLFLGRRMEYRVTEKV